MTWTTTWKVGTCPAIVALPPYFMFSSLKLSVRPTEYVKSLEDIVEQKLQLFAKFKGLLMILL